jgi:hypothetical protein
MRHRMRPRASSLVDVKAGPRPILRTRPSSLAGPRGPAAFLLLELVSKFQVQISPYFSKIPRLLVETWLNSEEEKKAQFYESQGGYSAHPTSLLDCVL